MPIYDYVCSNCKHRVEVIHGINASGPEVCPSCGQTGTMRRAFATPAIHFKGSGWAKKDRSSTSGSRTKASAGSGSGANAGDSAPGGSSSDGSSSDGSAESSSSKSSGDSSTSSTASGSED